VSNDLDALFASLRDDPGGPRLATAAAVRAVGDRRTRLHRMVGVGSVAVAVAVAGGTASVAFSGSAPRNGSTPRNASTPKTTTQSEEKRLCGRADLTAHPSTGQQWKILITISNRSTTRCDVRGFPGLVYTKPGGSSATLPTAHRGPANPTASLPRNGIATVTITIDSGRPDTHVTDCAEPSSYHGVSLVLGGDERVPLPGLSINAQCDTVSITSWSQAAG